MSPAWSPDARSLAYVSFHSGLAAVYVQTLATGRNAIRDPSLAQYYDKLALVTRGPLFSAERLRTIWHFQRGHYDRLLWDENARFGPARKENVR